MDPDTLPTPDPTQLPPAKLAAPPSRLARRLGDWVALDLRSVAVLRLWLALTVLGTLVRHGRGLYAFLSSSHVTEDLNATGLSVRQSSDLLLAGPLLLIGAAAGVMLLIGLRSRLAALLAWLVLVGVGTHPWAQVDGAEALLRLTLVWAMFLPIGARYAVDSAANEGPRGSDRHISVASLAILLQLSIATILGAPLLGPTADPAQPGPPATTLTGALAQSLAWVPPDTVAMIDVVALGCVAALWSPILIAPLRLAAAMLMVTTHLLLGVLLDSSVFVLLLSSLWLATVPTAAWDRLFAFLGSSPRTRITIWYGPHCPLRFKLMRTFFLLPDTPIRSTHENVELDVFRRQRNSWIVTNAKGYRYNRFRAFAEVCWASPILFPLGPLLRASFVEQIGDFLFDAGQRHHALLHRLAHKLRPHKTPLRLPRWQQGLALLALVVLLTWQFWVALDLQRPGQRIALVDALYAVFGRE